MATPPHETRIALIDALVALSATDLPYGDLYLHRAQELLEPVLSAGQYRALCHEREGLARTARELRALAARGDWRQVHALAQRGLHERQRIWENERLLALGDAVYAPRLFHAAPVGLALTGFSVDSLQHLGAARDACMARLRFALANDGELADFYRQRLACLAARPIVAGGATEVVQDTADLQRRIVEAADTADFAQAERLSAALLGAAANGAGHDPDGAPVRGASPRHRSRCRFPTRWSAGRKRSA